MKKLLKWAKPFIFLLLVICLLTIIVPVTYSYVPQFIKYVFDNVLEQKDAVNTLPAFLINFFNSFDPIKCVIVVGISLVIFQVLRGGLMLLNGYLKGYYAEGIAQNMRNKLFRHIGNLSFSYHNNVDSGDLIQRCTSDIETIKGFLSNQLPQILYIFASLISGAIQMASINVGIMLITFCVIPINFIASAIYFKYVSRKFDEIEKVEANMTTCIEENVNGARVVKAFAREKEEIEKFDKKNTTYKDEVEKMNRAMAYFWGFSDGITILQYAVTIGYCIFLAEKNLVGVGDIVVCISYISMLVYPIRSLGRIIGDFGKSIVAAKRVDEILSKDDEYVINGTLKPEIKGNISFKNVSFKFDDAESELLNNISFDIKAGETIAIVGKTGCGKSTIVHILERMLEYTSGSILIDGVELKDIDKKWLRKHIGIVLQDPFLYNKTIMENVRISSPNKSVDDVYRASQMAHVHNDILNFDKKYETLVGEKGVTLSGGQKQRLAIARMLILNKPVLIFDDSLSAVDTETDQSIRNSIKKYSKETTTIIITHRITTAKEADKIIVLENGCISDMGTHADLANRDGLYASLWKIQGALEEEFLNLVEKEVK
ncbi:MAG: ABC transporter ATP-binding protein [Bacilli bacterium]|nr:ABC transporter ATP-binding protein [Bacilli bacterium]